MPMPSSTRLLASCWGAAVVCFALTLATAAPPAQAQPAARAFVSCSSDGQSAPRQLVERFLNADCEACWAQPATAGHPGASGTAFVDWIVPGTQGDEAPLSAAALRDGLWRLQALGYSTPAGMLARPVPPIPGAGAPRLRVAHGSAMLGHVAISVEMTPARGGPWTVWVVLSERIDAGTDGSPQARDLVRGSLRIDWNARAGVAAREGRGALPTQTGPWRERRVMQLPEGVRADRLRLTGWIEDAQGRVASVVRSACPA